MSSNKAARAANAYGEVEDVTITSTNLIIGPTSANVCVFAGSSQNIDRLETEWARGRRILIWAGPGSSGLTFRDNQAVTNLVVIGLTAAVGEFDNIEFIAERDASGNEMWYQCRAVTNIS